MRNNFISACGDANLIIHFFGLRNMLRNMFKCLEMLWSYGDRFGSWVRSWMVFYFVFLRVFCKVECVLFVFRSNTGLDTYSALKLLMIFSYLEVRHQCNVLNTTDMTSNILAIQYIGPTQVILYTFMLMYRWTYHECTIVSLFFKYSTNIALHH